MKKTPDKITLSPIEEVDSGSNESETLIALDTLESYGQKVSLLTTSDIDTIVSLTHTCLMICILYYLIIQNRYYLLHLILFY